MAEEIPQHLRLTKKKKKITLLFVGCLVFVGIGVFMIWDRCYIVGSLCLIFFGLGTVVVGMQAFIPSYSYLELSDKGLTICHLFRKYFYRWDQISEFRIGLVQGHKMVLLNFSDKYEGQKTGISILEYISGTKAALRDTFGLTAEQLESLLTEFKSRYDVSG